MNKRRRDPEGIGRALAYVVQNSKLAWQLMFDGRVPVGLKLIPLMALLYLLSPIDLVPDFLVGLGQIDDVAIVLLALKLFVDLCPRPVVDAHAARLDDGPVVNGTYRVVDEP